MENLLTTHCLDFAQGFNASSPAGGYGGHGGGHTTGDGYGSRQKRPAAPAEDNYSFVSVPLSLFAWKHRGHSLFIVRLMEAPPSLYPPFLQCQDDLLRDLDKELSSWASTKAAKSGGTPMSLWDELEGIGEVRTGPAVASYACDNIRVSPVGLAFRESSTFSLLASRSSLTS